MTSDRDRLRCRVPGCTRDGSYERVRYHHAAVPVCLTHAARYIGWPAQDRERIAQQLWGWPSAAHLEADRAARDTPRLFDPT